MLSIVSTKLENVGEGASGLRPILMCNWNLFNRPLNYEMQSRPRQNLNTKHNDRLNSTKQFAGVLTFLPSHCFALNNNCYLKGTRLKISVGIDIVCYFFLST